VTKRKPKGILPRKRKLLYISRQFGFDPLAWIAAIKNLPWYFRTLRQFSKLAKGQSIIRLPTMLDKNAQSGSGDGHYFWQDLICAKWIHLEKPLQHFDVGSRLDGFIAHLLTFMSVTILDVRSLETKIPGLKVLLGNAQQQLIGKVEKFESVSSLHSIEHFGLGRYGDEIDLLGHVNGLRNISECVDEGGILYVSFPIGQESIEFNSQRVLDPMWPVRSLPEFDLEEFVLIPWRGSPKFDTHPEQVNKEIWGQAGLYKFRRT
jgi:hypothetical protein